MPHNIVVHRDRSRVFFVVRLITKRSLYGSPALSSSHLLLFGPCNLFLTFLYWRFPSIVAEFSVVSQRTIRHRLVPIPFNKVFFSSTKSTTALYVSFAVRFAQLRSTTFPKPLISYRLFHLTSTFRCLV